MALSRALFLLLLGVCSAQLDLRQLPIPPANNSPSLNLNASSLVTVNLPPQAPAVEQVKDDVERAKCEALHKLPPLLSGLRSVTNILNLPNPCATPPALTPTSTPPSPVPSAPTSSPEAAPAHSPALNAPFPSPAVVAPIPSPAVKATIPSPAAWAPAPSPVILPLSPAVRPAVSPVALPPSPTAVAPSPVVLSPSPAVVPPSGVVLPTSPVDVLPSPTGVAPSPVLLSPSPAVMPPSLVVLPPSPVVLPPRSIVVLPPSPAAITLSSAAPTPGPAAITAATPLPPSSVPTPPAWPESGTAVILLTLTGSNFPLTQTQENALGQAILQLLGSSSGVFDFSVNGQPFTVGRKLLQAPTSSEDFQIVLMPVTDGQALSRLIDDMLNKNHLVNLLPAYGIQAISAQLRSYTYNNAPAPQD